MSSLDERAANGERLTAREELDRISLKRIHHLKRKREDKNNKDKGKKDKNAPHFLGVKPKKHKKKRKELWEKDLVVEEGITIESEDHINARLAEEDNVSSTNRDLLRSIQLALKRTRCLRALSPSWS